MQGLMMDYPLTITSMLERARRMFPNKEIVTKAGPSLERFTYRPDDSSAWGGWRTRSPGWA